MHPLQQPDETLEELGVADYRVLQKAKGFRFSIDAVLLAHFAAAAVHKRTRVIDLGTGTGVIPLLLCGHTSVDSVIGLEIQPEIADMAGRSVALNSLEDRIRIITGDLRSPGKDFHSSSCDVITCNPPYMPPNRGMASPEHSMAVARHEITCTLDDVSRFAEVMLKDRGKLFMIHRADRIVDIASKLRSRHLEPKRLRFVYPKPGKPANLILVEAMKKGQPHCSVDPPLYVYDQNGNYTEEINAIYNKE